MKSANEQWPLALDFAATEKQRAEFVADVKAAPAKMGEALVIEPAATPASHGASRADRLLGSGLSAHILPTSATMIGVCMTVLSIGHLGPAGEWRMVIDKLLAVDALVFLISALLSFMSMRSRRLGVRFEGHAELVFIAGLGLLALGAVVLAFSIT